MAEMLPDGPPREENAAAGLCPERVRRDESRLYAGNIPPKLGGASEMKGKASFSFPLHSPCTTFAPRKSGCASEMKGKASFSFTFLSACTNFVPHIN